MKFKKRTSSIRRHLRSTDNAVNDGNCHTAFRHLIDAEIAIRGADQSVKRAIEDRHQETIYNFEDVCLREKKVAWNPEDGTAQERREWEEQERQRRYRKMGLEGRRKRK